MKPQSNSARRRVLLITFCVVATVAFGGAGVAHSATTCSQTKLLSLKSRVRTAHARWQDSGSAWNHTIFALSRAALVNYGRACADTLGSNLPLLLAGSVSIPYVDARPSEPSTRAPGDTVDLVIFHAPTSLSGSAGKTLTYNLMVANQGATATDPRLTDYLFADESPAPPITFNFSDDPAFANDTCGGSGVVEPRPGSFATSWTTSGPRFRIRTGRSRCRSRHRMP